MKNETLTRKQNQKTCDLSDSVCIPPWPEPHTGPGRPAAHARMRVVGGFLEPQCEPGPGRAS